MKNKNEKGFALVLSLTLLLVMSLLGGSLIVITSGDHQSNNTSDEYQQAFYVAETALLEAEKDLMNAMMGPWVNPNSGTVPMREDEDDTDAHDLYVAQLQAFQLTGSDGLNSARNVNGRYSPKNVPATLSEEYPSGPVSGLDRTTECFKSFKNLLNKDTIQVVKHRRALSFANLIIFPLLESVNYDRVDSTASDSEMERERLRMSNYFFEYFSVNIGSASFKGEGSSLKKTTTNVQRQGTSYKIYGCGYLEKNGDIEILIPLETIVILSS